jgi:GNAT superfamily N-acetyltransferase
MGRSGFKETGDDSNGDENATPFRLTGDSTKIELTYLGKGAGAVLWAHESEFEKGEHWYEYLVGAVAEGAKLWGISVPEDYYYVYAGFAEVFTWEEGSALESLYLFPKFRRRGIGTKTVKMLEESCDDRLTIWAGRATSPFYARLGYIRDESQGGFMMTKGNSAGKTFTEVATKYWKQNG